MDWDRAIAINRNALERIVAGLIAWVGLSPGGPVLRLPLPVHAAVLRVLRPVESALRRLIIIAARGVVVKLPPPGQRPFAGLPRRPGGRLAFALADPRKRFSPTRHGAARMEPRIHRFASVPLAPPFAAALSQAFVPVPRPSPPADGMVSAVRLSLRLAAVAAALADVPGQVRRLARWRARRKRLVKPKFTLPLRPGWPPGYRRKPGHEAEAVLAECHSLALDVLSEDSS